MINEAYELVEAFQLAANQPTSDCPIVLSKDRVLIRTKWMIDEIREFGEARDIYTQADALTDLLYYLLGAYVEMGVKPDGLFKIVHESNMRKLSTSEGIIKDEYGKVQKPLMWEHPDAAIKAEIDRLDP